MEMKEDAIEFENYVDNLDLTKTTKKAYIREYHKYLKNYGNIPLKNNPKIKNNIKNEDLYKTLSSRKQAYGMLIHYFRHMNIDKNVDVMRDYLTRVNIELNSNYKVRNQDLKIILPSKRKLLQFNIKNFNDAKWKAYIINYLLYNFNVRNLDLEVEIVNDDKLIKPNKNYLLLKPKKTTYIRDNYKTRDKYGKKVHYIKSEKFNYAIEEFVKQNDNLESIPLLGNKVNLTQEITKYTYENLSEGDIFKVFITDKKELKNYNKLAKSRGTTLDVIMNNYVLNN